MKMRLALAQMQISPGDSPKNLEKARMLIRQAARENAELVLLPELWASGYDLPNAAEWAAQFPLLQDTLSSLARENQIRIGGSLLREQDGKIFNSFITIDDQGRPASLYDKLHLFRLMNEHKWLQPGNRPVILDLPQVSCGLAVCYDLRFPELFRHYALQGAHLILLVAQWPVARSTHWQILLRARAIENQCFVAAVNAVGDCGGTIMGGSSMIIDPWGEIIASASSTQDALSIADLDFSKLQEIRDTIPVFQDRCPDAYN